MQDHELFPKQLLSVQGACVRASRGHPIREGYPGSVSRLHLRFESARCPGCLRDLHILRISGSLFFPGHRSGAVRELRGVHGHRPRGRLSWGDFRVVSRAGHRDGAHRVHDGRRRRRVVRHDGRNINNQCDRSRCVLSHDRAFSTRQPGALHSLSRGGRLCGRHRRSRMSGGHVPDGGRSGLAGDSGASGTIRVVEMEPGRAVWNRPVSGHEALGQCVDPADKRRARRWRIPSRSHCPRHLERRGESGGPAAHKHGGRKSVAGLGSHRPGARGLGRHGHANPQHADVDTGLTHLCEHESRRTRNGRKSGIGLEPGVQGNGVRQCDRRSGRRHGSEHDRARLATQQAVRGPPLV